MSVKRRCINLRARLQTLQTCTTSPTIQQVVFREGEDPSSRFYSDWGILTLTLIHRAGEPPAFPPMNPQMPYKIIRGCDPLELV
jgi:hypothetical protein